MNTISITNIIKDKGFFDQLSAEEKRLLELGDDLINKTSDFFKSTDLSSCTKVITDAIDETSTRIYEQERNEEGRSYDNDILYTGSRMINFIIGVNEINRSLKTGISEIPASNF